MTKWSGGRDSNPQFLGGHPGGFPVNLPPRKHWGYSAKSSTAQQTLGALKHYGLVESGKGRVWLSQRALRILLDSRESSSEKDQAIREAALYPRLFKKIWDAHGAELPSDATLRTNLLLSEGFASEEAATEFIAKYKETIRFAKLTESANISTDAALADEKKPRIQRWKWKLASKRAPNRPRL